MWNDETERVSRTAAAGRVADLHLLGPAIGVPVEEVQLQIVLLAVGEVDVYLEARRRVPAGGDAASAAGGLQGADVDGGGRPGVGRGTRGGHRGVAGQAGGLADDVVALGAVGADPRPLRRRVLLDERRRRVEEQPAEDGVGTRRPRDRNHHVSADLVVQVQPIVE